MSPRRENCALGGRRLAILARQRVLKSPARADAELGEHLVEVPLDGARAEEQLRADLRVRPACLGQPRDVLLLGRQLVARLVDALADLAAGGPQLVPGALGETVGAHGDERVMCTPELLASIDAPVRAPQPFAVQQPAAGELGTKSRAAKAVDGFPVEALGGRTLAHQRTSAGLQGECPLGLAGLRLLDQACNSTLCEARALRPAGSL